MLRAGSLAMGLLWMSLLVAPLAHAVDQPEPSSSDIAPPAEEGGEAAPATTPQATRPDNEAGEDWTWFGMGFESRQEQFRREMDSAVPGQGGPGGGGGGPGGGGRGR